jgi:small-conductance mechanosensitive channel
VEVFGIRLIGLSWSNLNRLLLTVMIVAAALLVRHGITWLVRAWNRSRPNERLVFWVRQAASVFNAFVILLAVVSIWFDNPSRLALPAGLVTAGIAFASQKVFTSIAGYLVVLRGRTFSVGDRIVMGGVRGDVISLGFIQTTILEMGEPPNSKGDNGEGQPVWVQARQYTGRVVTVTNDKVFDTPVYNYSREFPFIWEELRIPVPHHCDHARAEQILLAAARAETHGVKAITEEHRDRLRHDYFVEIDRQDPEVYYRITDNWLELTVRFVCAPYNVRQLKDRMSRRILAGFDEARIRIASTTFEVTELPGLRLEGDAVRSLTDALTRLAQRAGDGAGDARARRR